MRVSVCVSESSGRFVLQCEHGETGHHLLNTARTRISVGPCGQLQLGIMVRVETGPK